MGLAIPASLSRVDLMPGFLAHATLPNGEYEVLGDTDGVEAQPIPGTIAEFAATQGASGPKPTTTIARYTNGYLFARSGWGETRPFGDELAYNLRWGPARYIHGHFDHGSLNVSAWGARLLVDPGKYSYNVDPYRAWITGRSAHNVVTVDGVGWKPSATTWLVSHTQQSRLFSTTMKITGYPGVTHLRGVTFSRNLQYLIVDDRLTSTTTRTYRQLWHLAPDARPLVEPAWFRTQRTRGNVQVRQLITSGVTSRVLTGRTSPVQGWTGWDYGKIVPAPVVEVRRAGANVRFLTLIVTAPGTPASGVSELKLTSTGYSVVIKVGAKRERVVVDGTKVTITPLL
jgi:hypothetical protein